MRDGTDEHFPARLESPLRGGRVQRETLGHARKVVGFVENAKLPLPLRPAATMIFFSLFDHEIQLRRLMVPQDETDVLLDHVLFRHALGGNSDGLKNLNNWPRKLPKSQIGNDACINCFKSCTARTKKGRK